MGEWLQRCGGCPSGWALGWREVGILGRNMADYGVRVERGASGTSNAESVNWA